MFKKTTLVDQFAQKFKYVMKVNIYLYG